MINDITSTSGECRPENDNSESSDSRLVEILVPPDIAKVHVGDCYSDTREEIIHAVRENVKRIRKVEGGPSKTVKTVLWRVVRVDSRGVLAIIFNDPSAAEILFSAQKFLGLVRVGHWVFVSIEPLAANRMADSQFSESAIRRRERDYKLIKPLIELGDDMFAHGKRGEVIKKIVEERGVAPNQIYRIFRRWLQGGMTKNALIGRWFRRNRKIGIGAAILSVAEVESGQKPAAVGRRRHDESACVGGDPTVNSFHVHRGDVQKMVQGMRQFGDTRLGKHKVRRAYLLTVGHYYLPDLMDLQPVEIEKKLQDPLAPYGPDKYPSERQFRYWIRTDRSIVENLTRCEGQKNVNLKYRPLQMRTEDKTSGPGSNMQIDPTRLDVLLVHKITRRPIGRATVYLVVDCFSHLITGYEILVEDESYGSAAVALLATAEDKVELCRRYGVEISEAQWPSACLPERLHADSALNSLKAHVLVTGNYLLHGEGLMDLTILPAYRADLKGLVEALLGSLTETTVIHLPGYSTGDRKRATTDPKAYASLDIDQLHKIVIQWILSVQRRVIKDYNRTEAMIRDGLVPTPLNLWNWGVSNCSGVRKRWDLDLLRMLCLPQDKKARITRRGLEFKGIAYEPASAGDLPDFAVWPIEAGSCGEWNETVTYHPRSMSDLWLHHEGRLIGMKPVGTCVEASWSLFDLEADRNESAAANLATETKKVPADAAAEASKKAVVDQGERQTTEARGSIAKRRLEKADVPKERAAEQSRLSGRPPVLNMPNMTPAAPTIMADADAAEMVERIRSLGKGAKP